MNIFAEIPRVIQTVPIEFIIHQEAFAAVFSQVPRTRDGSSEYTWSLRFVKEDRWHTAVREREKGEKLKIKLYTKSEEEEKYLRNECSIKFQIRLKVRAFVVF